MRLQSESALLEALPPVRRWHTALAAEIVNESLGNCRSILDFIFEILDGRKNLKSQIQNLKSECWVSHKFYPTDSSLQFTNPARIATAKLI